MNIRQPFLSYTAVCLTVIAIFAGASANAGTLICKSRSLSNSDQRAVEAIFRRSIGAFKINSSESTYCRNFGNARAWLETTRVKAEDGAFDHMYGDCARGFWKWSCDVSRLRTIEVSLRDSAANVSFYIPVDMRPADAREVVAVATSVVRAGLTNEQACYSSHDEADQLRDLGNQYLDPAYVLTRDVSRETSNGASEVMVQSGLLGLSFMAQRAESGAETFKFKCWTEFIIVG